MSDVLGLDASSLATPVTTFKEEFAICVKYALHFLQIAKMIKKKKKKINSLNFDFTSLKSSHISPWNNVGITPSVPYPPYGPGAEP